MILSNGPIFSLLAIYMPMAALAALLFLLRAVLPLQTAILLISGGLSALAASLYCDFMKDVRSSRTTANIRGAIIMLIISYIFASLFRRRIPWGERFAPDFTNILASVGALYVWGSVISLKKIFSIRKRFEDYTALYQGEQLHRALYDDSDLLQNIDSEIAKVEKRYLIQFIIMVIMLFFILYNKINIHPALYFLLLLVLASGLGIFGFFEIIRREQYYAAEGLSLSVADRSRHMLGVMLFSILAIVTAIALSFDKSLISFSLIGNFFGWLLGLLRNLLSSVKWGGMATEPVEPMPQYEPLTFPFEPIAESEPLPIWSWLKYGLYVLAAAVFVWFMILPLFDRSKKKMSFRQKLNRIIVEWFRGAVAAIASFFTAIISGAGARKLRKPSAEEIQKAAGAVLGAYAHAKKRALKQSVTLFARLIIWGGEVRQTAWKPVYAPGEYCAILAEKNAPAENDLNQKIIRCGQIFEKALYSADMLSDAEGKEFKRLVEEVTAVT